MANEKRIAINLSGIRTEGKERRGLWQQFLAKGLRLSPDCFVAFRSLSWPWLDCNPAINMPVADS